MKKNIFAFILTLCAVVSFGTANAQNNGNSSYENRAIAALNDCVQDYRQGGFYSIEAYLVSSGGCAAGPATTGLRLTYQVVANPNCTPGPLVLCPPTVLLGEVTFCTGDVESATCY